MTKIIAIIQGPVASPGRTFRTNEIVESNKSVSRNESDLVVDFDSSQTIIQNVRQLKNHGIDVIYSGWIGDCSETLKNEIEMAGAEVILSDGNKAPAIHEKNSPFKGVLSINNKSKQFYSIFKALESVKSLSDCIVIKIRSDISFDLHRLIKEINRLEKQILNGAIVVQYLKSDNLRENSRISSVEKPDLWIPDFLFFGRGDVLFSITKDLVNRSLSNNSYNDSPHVDLGNAIVRYHWPLFPKLKKRNESLKILLKNMKIFEVIGEVFGRLAKKIIESKMISLYQNELLIPASKEIQHSIFWRGDSYKENLKKHQEMDKGLIYGKE